MVSVNRGGGSRSRCNKQSHPGHVAETFLMSTDSDFHKATLQLLGSSGPKRLRLPTPAYSHMQTTKLEVKPSPARTKCLKTGMFISEQLPSSSPEVYIIRDMLGFLNYRFYSANTEISPFFSHRQLKYFML